MNRPSSPGLIAEGAMQSRTTRTVTNYNPDGSVLTSQSVQQTNSQGQPMRRNGPNTLTTGPAQTYTQTSGFQAGQQTLGGSSQQQSAFTGQSFANPMYTKSTQQSQQFPPKQNVMPMDEHGSSKQQFVQQPPTQLPMGPSQPNFGPNGPVPSQNQNNMPGEAFANVMPSNSDSAQRYVPIGTQPVGQFPHHIKMMYDPNQVPAFMAPPQVSVMPGYIWKWSAAANKDGGPPIPQAR